MLERKGTDLVKVAAKMAGQKSGDALDTIGLCVAHDAADNIR